MKRFGDFGIRARLFLAFGSVAAMTVAASVVAWIAFGSLSAGLSRIATDNLPAVSMAARLAEIGGNITATAPKLVAATDEADRDRAWSELTENLDNIGSLLIRREADLFPEPSRRILKTLVDAMAASLRDLDTNVRRRFFFRSRNEELTDRLRWTHADFLDEVEPMVADARFNIEMASERIEEGFDPAAADRLKSTLREETLRQEALLRLNADGNLATGLIARAATMPSQQALDDTFLFLSAVIARLQKGVASVRDLPGALSLSQSLQDILAYAEGGKSLFDLRRDELKILEEGRRLLEVNRDLVVRLQDLITERVNASNVATLTAARQSQDLARQGRILLLLAAGISLGVAILVVWLYVGKNLVRRITNLDRSMRAIAAGDLKAEVPTGGSDEISTMATSLSTFRDTLVETQTELVQAGKLAALGQLSAGIAHELNQPLAAIRSFAHNARILIDRERSDEAVENLEKISGLTEKTAATLNHFKKLARWPSKSVGSADLGTVVADALTLLEAPIHNESVELTNRVAPNEIAVRAGPIRLEQVLINVIGNAIDAMRDRECRVLDLSVEEDNDRVSLNISDSGVGIRSEELSQVFDPFFTTKPVGKGLGLGLSISYNIIKDFGGSVRVSSEPGEGTCFTIVLQRA